MKTDSMKNFSKQLIFMFMLMLCGTVTTLFSENGNAIKAIAAMDTIRDTTTLANMRAKHDALVKDGWDIIGIEKHKEFDAIIGVRPITSKKKNDPYADTVFFASKDINSRWDTIITKTVFRNGIPVKAYFNNKEFILQ